MRWRPFPFLIVKTFRCHILLRDIRKQNLLPVEAESQFTKIIRTRIVGEARRTIQDQIFDSVVQLTKYLEQIYGSSKNVYQLQGELDSVY